jgi:hypothetical protein
VNVTQDRRRGLERLSGSANWREAGARGSCRTPALDQARVPGQICSSVYLRLRTGPFWRVGFGGSVLVVRGFRRGDRFLLRNGDGGKQGLPLRLAETPAASRWPRRVVAADPSIESRSAREAERRKATRWNSLAMVLGKRSTIPFDGGLIVLIREWSISPRARELNFVMLWIAAIFCAAIGQHIAVNHGRLTARGRIRSCRSWRKDQCRDATCR